MLFDTEWAVRSRSQGPSVRLAAIPGNADELLDACLRETREGKGLLTDYCRDVKYLLSRP